MFECSISASFGGIFGLCLGGSVISLIEFLYYFTFQLFSSANSDDRPISGGVSIRVHTIGASFGKLAVQRKPMEKMHREDGVIIPYIN